MIQKLFVPRHRHEAEITFAMRKVFRAVTFEEPEELIAALLEYGLCIVHIDELEDLRSELEDLVGTRMNNFNDAAKRGHEK